MKKFTSYLVLTLLGISPVLSATLSPESALRRASGTKGINSQNFNENTRTPAASPKLQITLKTATGKPAIYIFSNNDSEGFMIVSAEDSALPLLGYSDSGYFDPDNIPPALEYWLSQYQKQIEYAMEHPDLTRSDGNIGVTLPSSWTPVGPLLSTNWNQDAPFNNLCPKVNNVNCYTGCVATSMAQVLNYHKYPEKGNGSISYTSSALNLNLSMNFSQTTFDWNNMLNSYSGNYSEAQANAVATLMKACGYAVKMNYGTNYSGAISGNIPPALVNYFGYDKSIRYFSRDMYTYTDWASMIYNNLKNYGPVIYDGAGSGGGHSWVCDGYNGQGMFHMNWGWGGMSNGYYTLDALNPNTIGIGGGSGSFNYDQGCIFNIQPNKNEGTPQSFVFLYGTLNGVISGQNVILNPTGTVAPGWGYQGLEPITINLGVGYAKADSNDPLTYLYTYPEEQIQLSGSNYIPASNGVMVPLGRFSLQDGVKYKVVATYKAVGGDWTELPAGVGLFNYFYLTKNGSAYTVENVTPLQFSATSASVDSDLYYRSSAKVSATITNPNDTELTRNVAFALVNIANRVAFIGDSQKITIAPGNSLSLTWPTSLNRQSGTTNVSRDTEFYPALYDTENFVLFYTSPDVVVMHPAAGVLSVEVSMDVPGAPKGQTNQPGVYAYDIENARDFNIVTDLTVTGGYLGDQLYLGIYGQPTANETQGYIYLRYYQILDYVFMNVGESISWTKNIDFPSAVIDADYYAGILDGTLSLMTSSPSALLTIKGIGEAGVDQIVNDKTDFLFIRDKGSENVSVIAPDSIASVDVYYLNGMKAPAKVIYNGEKASVDLSGTAKGLKIISVMTHSGLRKSIKY